MNRNSIQRNRMPWEGWLVGGVDCPSEDSGDPASSGCRSQTEREICPRNQDKEQRLMIPIISNLPNLRKPLGLQSNGGWQDSLFSTMLTAWKTSSEDALLFVRPFLSSTYRHHSSAVSCPVNSHDLGEGQTGRRSGYFIHSSQRQGCRRRYCGDDLSRLRGECRFLPNVRSQI